MNSPEQSELNAAQMVALRTDREALKVITDRLHVHQMGSADHIKTKHEVKQWLESAGDQREAQAIVERAQARRTLRETQLITQSITQRQQRGQRLEP
jgi:hypothetical protein